MDWTDPPPGFNYILFERVNLEENEDRFYYIGFQPALFDLGIITIYGRKGEAQRLRITPARSLEAAWPAIRKQIRRRLRHGYRIVGPVEYVDGGGK